MDRRLGGPQGRSKKFPAPAGTRIIAHPASSPALYRWATRHRILMEHNGSEIYGWDFRFFLKNASQQRAYSLRSITYTTDYEWSIGRMWQQDIVPYFTIIFQNIPQENEEKLRSKWQVPGQRIQHKISRVITTECYTQDIRNVCFNNRRVWNHHHHHHRRRRRLQVLGLMACSDSEFNFSEFMKLRTFGTTPWTGDQPDVRPLPTQDRTIQKTRTHILPRAGSEPAIPVFERSKTVLALDRATTGTSTSMKYVNKLSFTNINTSSGKETTWVQLRRNETLITLSILTFTERFS
jgi:hypothetical protein